MELRTSGDTLQDWSRVTIKEVSRWHKSERDISRKLKYSDMERKQATYQKHVDTFGNFRERFYRWKRTYAQEGESGLISSKPCPQNPKLCGPAFIEEKILHLRKTYHLGQVRNSCFLIVIMESRCRPVGFIVFWTRNGVNCLRRNAKKRTVKPHRYEKHVPSHHIHVDVKFLNFNDALGHKMRHNHFSGPYRYKCPLMGQFPPTGLGSGG
mgnify:CR=1 FL=1